MSEAIVRAICEEFDVKIIKANEFPKPGETRAVATLLAVLEKYGEGHLRLVVSTLMETKGNQGLMTAPILWATSDLVEACSEWIEKDLSDWYQAWDKIPLGWITWHCQSLYGIVKVRQAAAGAMYLMLRIYTKHSADREVDFSFLRKTGDVEDNRALRQVPAETAIEAGKTLLAVKETLTPREFRAWLRETAGMTRHAADRYMRKAAEGQAPVCTKRTAKEMADIGLECLKMKATLPQGEFKPWLREQCSVAVTTANSYMQIARLWGDYERMLEMVQATGLLILAQNKTPAAVRENVEALVAKGYFVTREKIEELMKPANANQLPQLELAA